MSYPMEYLRDECPLPESGEDVMDRLAGAADVLELLRRADSLAPPEIDMWGALTLGDAPELFVHGPRPIIPPVALAVAESMVEQVSAHAGAPLELAGAAQAASISCADMSAEVLSDLSAAYRDHLTRRGPDVVAVMRAAATRSSGLTLGRWRQAEEVLEVGAWLLASFADGQRPQPGVIDPISGAYTRQFFEEALRKELARHQRQVAELSVILLQLRPSAAIMADQRPSPAVLATTGELMLEELREADVVARLDSHRLAALLPCTSPRRGLMAASQVGEALQASEALGGWSIDIGVSGLGVEPLCPQELIDQATHAMLSAQKSASGNPFVYV
ncbi:MAG: diguanylate cyclase [Armatimonadota bacterium]|nr:diguanylate cyclase [Armatimonadota bacterium]